jgi:hypothetical protein
LVGVRIGEHLHTSCDEVVLELAPVVLLRVDKLMKREKERERNGVVSEVRLWWTCRGWVVGGWVGGERLRTLMQSQ